MTLPGVGDACSSLVVKNQAGATVRSQPSICADTFGDGQGAITYIGTCDAQSPAHTVALTLLSLEDVDGASITDFVNPTASGPIILPAICVENADTLVVFNLTIMRSADQGFFDVAVNFEDVFRSAKLDRDAADLLHAPGGTARLDTAIIGLACTGGPAADTYLYNSGLTLTCDGTPIDIPLTGPEGNIYSTTLAAPAPFAQVATYLGVEALTNPDTTPLKKAWFNIAFGLSAGTAGNCIQWSAGVGTTCDTSNCSLTPGVCPAVIPATVIAHLFDDTNGNGVKDTGELNVGGARFELTLSAGAPGSGQFANSNASGNAVFTNVPQTPTASRRLRAAPGACQPAAPSPCRRARRSTHPCSSPPAPRSRARSASPSR